MSLSFAILKNDEPDSHVRWEKACGRFKIDYHIVDLTREDWFHQLSNKRFDCCLLRPPCKLSKFIELYKQRVRIIDQYLKIPVFPSLSQVEIYEDKRYLSYFLKARNIPHPETKVFYYKDEALKYLGQVELPLVGKTSHGAGGTGVEILKTRKQAESYVSKAFSRKGIKRAFGPNRVTGNVRKWARKALDLSYFFRKLKEYIDIYSDSQKGYVIFQQYIPHDFEWRAVNIGGSYFAHKKIKAGDKASGSKGIDYVKPPIELLDFVRSICEAEQFDNMAIDLFEDSAQGYLVNELQTIFGHEQSYILRVNGKIGRYVYKEGEWIFQEGDFNTNESFDLRLQHVMKLMEQRKNG